MPGLGTIKIFVDTDVLGDMIRDRYATMEIEDWSDEIRDRLCEIPDDAVLMEVRPLDREPGKLMMVWSHPSFPSDEIPYSSPEPRIPADWDYIK